VLNFFPNLKILDGERLTTQYPIYQLSDEINALFPSVIKLGKSLLNEGQDWFQGLLTQI
jgi:hypothetical protein